MKVTRNAVYTRIVKAVRTAYPSCYYSGRLEPVPPSLPAIYVREIGYLVPLENVTFSNDDDQHQSTFEIQVYSNLQTGAETEAYGIMDVADGVMKDIGYILDMLEPMPNADATIFRLIGRWHRHIGGADEMPPELP